MLSGPRRTLAIVGAHLVILYGHGLAIATGEMREACATGPRLYDVVHVLQDAGVWWAAWATRVSNDWFLWGLSAVILYALIISPQRQLILRRFIVFHAMMAVIRASSIWVTTIPSPTSACRDRFMTASPFERAITLTVDAIGMRHEWFGLGAGGNTCCDIIISGHAAVFVVAAMLIGMIWRARWVRVSAWVVATIGLLASITPDRHYTVEILLTVLIGVPLIALYQIRTRAPGRIVRWIEEPETFGPWTPR